MKLKTLLNEDHEMHLILPDWTWEHSEPDSEGNVDLIWTLNGPSIDMTFEEIVKVYKDSHWHKYHHPKVVYIEDNEPMDRLFEDLIDLIRYLRSHDVKDRIYIYTNFDGRAIEGEMCTLRSSCVDPFPGTGIIIRTVTGELIKL